MNRKEVAADDDSLSNVGNDYEFVVFEPMEPMEENKSVATLANKQQFDELMQKMAKVEIQQKAPFSSQHVLSSSIQQSKSQQKQMSNNANLEDNEWMKLPLPEPPSQAKDWHALITPDLRNHLVGKLVKAIFPSPVPAAILDQRIRDLISYARNVENDMFEAAPNKEAYYHMLAEKIYKIQKELQEKKNRRLHERQQLAHRQLGGGQKQEVTSIDH